MRLIDRLAAPVGSAPEAPGKAPPRSAAEPIRPGLKEAKQHVHKLLVERYAEQAMQGDRTEIRRLALGLLDEYATRSGTALTIGDRETLVEALLDDVMGLGPLEPLLQDPEVSEIMITGPAQVYIERRGQLEETPVRFTDEAELMRVIDRIVSSIGRRVDESSPMVDARLPDGARVNVILPPLALRGPCVTIRKFLQDRLAADDLVKLGSASPAMIEFLQQAVAARLSIIVSGGTSSGKTTLLNVLSGFIPPGERIITIEDAAELRLRQRHVVPLEARPPNIEGRGAVTIRDLVRNALRMRPDRIIVGEVRGGEALDMLQAMNTGHAGSMSTLHANSCADAISRLETMALMAGSELPASAIRKQIAAAIDLIVHMERVQGGARKITSISEVAGLKAGEVELRDIFIYRQSGLDATGAAVGEHVPTGCVPERLGRMRVHGSRLSEAIFRVPAAG